MNLNLENKKFLICGATSGFGRGVVENLLTEGAKILAVARDQDKLDELSTLHKGAVTTFSGDLTREENLENLFRDNDMTDLSGALVNAGGPPAMKFMETEIG